MPATAFRGPIVDTHTHPRLPGFPSVRSEPHRLADYRRAIRGLDVRYTAVLVMAPQGEIERTRRMNDRALELASRGAPRFFSLCSVHPGDGAAALEEVDRVASHGARGLKLHPNTQAFDVADSRVRDVVARAADHDLPVLFDAYSPFDADQPGKFVRLAMEVPNARLVLAHAHGPRFADLLVYEILARYDWWKRNVWVDLSATGPLLSESPFREQFLWVLRKVGVDRLLFGSDYPLDEPRHAVEAIAGLGFSRSELKQVFYSNAVQLYDLKTPPRGGPRPAHR
jgi:hypothetical protein